MKDILLAIKKANRNFLPLLQAHFLELFSIFLFCELFDQFFKATSQLATSQGIQNLPALFGRLTVSLLSLVLLTHWVPLRTYQYEKLWGPENLFNFAARHLKNFSLESFRALGMTLLFSLLLILPGFWKYLQFILVPYVVLCDPEYTNGKVDALQESKKLMTGLTPLIFVLFLLFLPVYYLIAQITEPYLITQTPIPWLLSFLGQSLGAYYFNLLLFELYRVRKTGLNNRA